MSTSIAVVVFVISLVLMLGATDLLVQGLDHLGVRLSLSEGLLGLLTALGADSPEISSAIVALQGGYHAVGLGVVIGSNLFNLAALLGLGAVLAGRVSVQRASLVVDGGVGLLVTFVMAALILHLAAPALCAIVLLLLLIPYVAALAVSPQRLAKLALPDRWSSRLAATVKAIDEEAAEDPRVSQTGAKRGAVVLIIPALAVIVSGSVGLVQAAVTLATAWRIPEAIVGTVILAGLTSLPNAYAAARLALHGRGAALVSETFNSNTINLVVGLRDTCPGVWSEWCSRQPDTGSPVAAAHDDCGTRLAGSARRSLEIWRVWYHCRLSVVCARPDRLTIPFRCLQRVSRDVSMKAWGVAACYSVGRGKQTGTLQGCVASGPVGYTLGSSSPSRCLTARRFRFPETVSCRSSSYRCVMLVALAWRTPTSLVLLVAFVGRSPCSSPIRLGVPSDL